MIRAALAISILFWLAASALAHDMLIPANGSWFDSLRVPSDGLPLQKGNSCCSQSDCKPRLFRVIGPGLYQMQNEAGEWLPFGDNIWITDPDVRANNPYLQFVGCIWSGTPVCAVMGPAGG